MQPQPRRHLLLGGQAGRAQRGERPGAAAQHGHEHAPLAALQTLHVTDDLVDPHRHLEAEGGGHGVLAVRAPGEQGVLGPLGEIGPGGQNRGELPQEDLVGPAHLEELAGLRDVLGGRAPVHVAAGVALTGAVQRPHQRDQRVSGARQPLPDRREIQEGEVRLANDLPRSRLGNDAQLALRLGESGLDVQPGLEARGLGEERADTGVLDAE
jgi:hypothetical protein